jgi:hypothetical protein
MKTGFVPRIVWLLVVMLAFVGPVFAQEAPPSNTASVDLEKEEQAAKEKAKKDAEEKVEQSKSVRERMFSDVRNSAAFSVGVFENYDSNVFNTSGAALSDFYTLLSPRFVANFQREHTMFGVEYGGGYRFYSRFTDLDRMEHTGTLQFRYEASPHTVVSVSDSVSFVPLNSLSFLQQPSFTGGPSGVSPQLVFLGSQNIFSNVFNGEVTHALSESTSLRFYGGYDLARYSGTTTNDSDGYRAGFQLLNRPSRKLTINTGYEFQDLRFNNLFVSTKLNRLTVGLNYALRPTVSVFVSAGPELATIPGKSQVGTYVQGGIQKSLPSTQFTVGYMQGTQYDRGLAVGLFIRTVYGSYTRRLGEKFRVSLSEGYIQDTSLAATTLRIKGFQSGTSVEYAVRPDLTFVASYYYVWQSSNASAIGVPALSRSLATLGLEYRLPNLFHR